MYRIMRITFCCLAVALVAAAVFIFVYLGIVWGIVTVAAAAVCFFIMMFFKKKQEEQEKAQNPPPPVGDFITGKVPVQKDGGETDGEHDEKQN